MSYFEALNITKKFNNLTVNLSFTAEQGTFTTILGPSGSGKSTILKIISGLEKSDSPETEILLNNKNITTLKPAKRNCGMVFQNSALFLNMNVEQNIEYGLKCAHIKKDERKKLITEWLKKFNMEGFEKRKPSTLSGGEIQRTALARTLIVKPQLLLLDEPLSALDAHLRKSLAKELRALQQKENLTVIMVTHDITEAKNVSDRILLIKKGHLAWNGTPENFDESLIN